MLVPQDARDSPLQATIRVAPPSRFMNPRKACLAERSVIRNAYGLVPHVWTKPLAAPKRTRHKGEALRIGLSGVPIPQASSGCQGWCARDSCRLIGPAQRTKREIRKARKTRWPHLSCGPYENEKLYEEIKSCRKNKTSQQNSSTSMQKAKKNIHKVLNTTCKPIRPSRSGAPARSSRTTPGYRSLRSLCARLASLNF